MPLVFNTDRERMAYLTEIRIEAKKLPCRYCGEKYLPKYRTQLYCTPSCQHVHYVKMRTERIRKRVMEEQQRWCEMIMKKVNEI